jgi:hypothetical protein
VWTQLGTSCGITTRTYLKSNKRVTRKKKKTKKAIAQTIQSTRTYKSVHSEKKEALYITHMTNRYMNSKVLSMYTFFSFLSLFLNFIYLFLTLFFFLFLFHAVRRCRRADDVINETLSNPIIYILSSRLGSGHGAL